MMFEAHSDLGYCLRKQGDFEAALAAYDRALEIQPKYAEAIEYRAEAYLGLNRLDEAKQAYMTLFKGQSDQASALLEAMQHWADENGEDEAFSAWVVERTEIAGQTKSVSQLRDADW
jgi:superkiller protein 3